MQDIVDSLQAGGPVEWAVQNALENDYDVCLQVGRVRINYQSGRDYPATTNYQQAVQQFFNKFGITAGVPGGPYDPEALQMGVKLVREELHELLPYLVELPWVPHTDDYLGKMFKEMADVVYVVHYLSACFGYDLGAVFDAVHWSNMGKQVPEEGYKGKIQKGPTYEEPQVDRVLAYQRERYLTYMAMLAKAQEGGAVVTTGPVTIAVSLGLPEGVQDGKPTV